MNKRNTDSAAMSAIPQKPSVWFVKQDGKVYGPFDSTRLKKLGAAGKVDRDSEISKDRNGPWTEASRVRGLFPEIPGATEDSVNEGAKEEEKPVSKKPWGWFQKRSSKQSPHPASTTAKAMWYFRGEDDDATGPFTATEMATLIGRNVVTPATFVLRHGGTRWETAFSAGLFLGAPDDEPEEKDAAETPASVSNVEEVLWKGQASHHANYGTYVLCALGSPFYYPAKWGIQRFRERRAIRYEITSRKVRVQRGADHELETVIPIADIRRVKLETPPALEGSRVCNITLVGKDGGLLTVLEGIPLDEASLVISLCESAASRQLSVDASARVLAHQRVQDEKERRRLEQEQRASLRVAQWRASTLERRAREAEQRAGRLTAALGGDCPEDVIDRSVSASRHFRPPPPPGNTSGSGWFGWLGRGESEVWVRGFYRNGKWVKPHKRRKHR